MERQRDCRHTLEMKMTRTELLLIEAREIARRTLGAGVSDEVIGKVLDVLALERMPQLGGDSEIDERTFH